MKNKKHYTREESTLLQEIVRTYRYPDGTLNGIAVFISTLALVLLLIFGHFTINGLKHLAGLDKVSASELSLENIEDYITETYLDAIDDYTDKKIDHDTAKRRILKQLAAFINSSDAFTDEQKVELIETIKQYLDDITIEELIKNNQESVEKLTTEFNKYQKENETAKELLLNTLETEIRTNKEYTQEQLDALNELHDKLEKLELTHWNSINNMLAETIQRYDHYSEELQTNSYGGLQVWKADAKYDINTLVIYNIGADYENPNGVIGAQNDVRIYKNLTGINTDVSPNKDKDNWQQMSLGEAIQNIYNITTGDIAAFDEWVKNHETNSDGSVIDQYVTYNNNIYQNITGEYDSNKTPDQDKANWEQLSIMQALEKNLQKMITDIQGDMASYKEWLENHKTDADGSVIHQYVTYHNEVYQNITGEYDPSKTPDKDPTNWEKVSVFDAIKKNLQEMIDNMYKDLSAYTDWLENHKTNAGGDVINQYVTYEEKLYQNISGEYDPSKTPDQDPANWKEVSLGEAIQNVYNTYITDTFGDTAVWSADAEYKIDDYVIYKNKIYRNITGEYTSTNPAEDKANWKEASAFGEINNNYQTFLERLYGGIAEWDAAGSYKPNAYVMYKNQLYRNITGVNTDVTPDKDTVNWAASSMITVIQNTYNTFLAATGAKDYVAGEAHSAGEYVIYNNTIYKNVSDNAGAMNGAPIPGVTDGDGTESVWVAITITDMIDKNYQTFITTVGAEDYNNEHSYQAGDYVIKDGTLYKATDVTSGSFDASKWEKVTVTDQIDTLRNDLDALAVKSSTDLEAVNENLTDIINKNKSLSDEQRAQMLQLINDNADASAEGMDKLRSDLTAVINSNDTKNEKEREKLLKQLNALSDNTAAHMDDYEKRIKNLEDRTTSLDGSQKFQFDCKNGIQGYSVDGVFYPF